MADENGKNYVIGKGRVYLDLFAAGTKKGTGERYLGNTPEFSQTQAQESLDHIDADQGLNVKDDSFVISNELTGTFSTDNINAENVAMFFGGDLSKLTVASAVGLTDADVTVLRGRTYQLGADDATPMGTKKVDNVTIKKVVPPVAPDTEPTLVDVPLEGNVEVDLARARVYIESDAPDIANGDVLRFGYDQEGYTNEVIIGKGQQVSGAMRFLANNPKGPNRDYYYPYVKITSNGDYALKGDEWQVMSFNFEVLKLNGSTERVYIDGVATA